MIDSEQILKEELRKAFPDLNDGEFALALLECKKSAGNAFAELNKAANEAIEAGLSEPMAEAMIRFQIAAIAFSVKSAMKDAPGKQTE